VQERTHYRRWLFDKFAAGMKEVAEAANMPTRTPTTGSGDAAGAEHRLQSSLYCELAHHFGEEIGAYFAFMQVAAREPLESR
jgi:hypothetical protein